METTRKVLDRWLVPVLFGCSLVVSTLGLIAGASMAFGQAPDPQAAVGDLEARQKALGGDVERLKAQVEGWERRGAQLQSLIGIILGVNTAYAIALAFGTYLNLRPLYETARRDLEELRRFVKDTEDRVKEAERKMSSLVESTKKDMAEFRSEIRADLPTLQNMDKALRNILHQLRKLLPVDQDWRDKSYFPALRARQREDVLYAERIVAGFRFFELGKVPSFRRIVSEIYQGLGQFYGSQFSSIVAGGAPDSFLFARSMMYFEEACDIDPDNAGAYKDQGVLHTTAGEDDASRRSARQAFERCRAIDPGEPGGAFGLAWIEYKDAEWQKAVDVISDVIAKTSWRPGERRKYLADAYLNRACFRIKLLTVNASDADYQPMLDDLKSGKDVARQENYWPQFRGWVEGEIATGDFQPLANRFSRQFTELLS